jgi:FixJ family two-component response regulator
MIHLVDDEKSIRRAITILADSADIDIKAYASAREFLDDKSIQEGEILILDIHMPGMNGFELLEELKSKGIKLNVIILTAFDDAANREQAQKYGVKAFFRKPVDSEALIDTIKYLNSAD